MANATFYTFSKRKNSTKQPTGSGTVIDVNLKSGTSLLSPTFLLNLSGRPTYNYLEFEGRYYFIKDIISIRNDLWELHCIVDALASWKSTIGSTSAVILYATQGLDPNTQAQIYTNIIDQRIPVESSVIIHNSAAAIPLFDIHHSTFGSIVISVTGVGSFGNYVLDDNSDLYHMIEDVDTWWNNINISSVEDALKQFFYGGSAGDCLKNAIALPIALPLAPLDPNLGPSESLELGPFECKHNGSPIYVHRVNNPVMHVSTTVSIPWQYTDWRRHKPYTEVQLYLPFIGMVTLDADELINVNSLDITYSLNITSGDLAVEVGIDDPIKIIMTASNNVAMSLPFGSANIPVTKGISAAVTAISTALTVMTKMPESASGAAIMAAGAGSGLAAGAGALLGSGSQSGGGGLSGGASQGLTDHILCFTLSRTLTDTQARLDPVIGQPVYERHTLNTYSGFIQTDGLSVAGNMTDQERELINASFDRGAYYE